VITRRTLLRGSLFGGALLSTAAMLGRHLGGDDFDPKMATRLRVLSPKEHLVLEKAAERILRADEGEAPAPSLFGIGLFVDRYLTHLPPALQRQAKGLLLVLEHGSSPLRRFSRMSGEAQDAVLTDWAQSRLALRRQGFQALRTFAFLGYYRRDEVWPVIGYSGPIRVP
jgi:hypothetical protein